MKPGTSPRLLPPDLTSSGKKHLCIWPRESGCVHTPAPQSPLSLTAEAVTDAPVPYLLILLSLCLSRVYCSSLLSLPSRSPPPPNLLFLPNNKISAVSIENSKPFLCWKRNLFKIRKNTVPLPYSCKNAGTIHNHHVGFDEGRIGNVHRKRHLCSPLQCGD